MNGIFWIMGFSINDVLWNSSICDLCDLAISMSFFSIVHSKWISKFNISISLLLLSCFWNLMTGYPRSHDRISQICSKDVFYRPPLSKKTLKLGYFHEKDLRKSWHNFLTSFSYVTFSWKWSTLKDVNVLPNRFVFKRFCL